MATNDAKRLTKRDRIAAELRSMIASGDLPRGSRVQQDDLALRFETSTTPVREALRQLEAEGLLVAEPHRGVRVSEVSVNDVHGVYVARRLLEPFAAQLATLRFSRRDLSKTRGLNDTMQQAKEAGDAARLREANRALHFLIYQRCEIPSLVSLIEGLWLQFPWDILDVLHARTADSIQEHADILAHIEDGDIPGVKASVGQHIRNSYAALVQHLTGEPPAEDPFDEIRAESGAN